MKDKINKRTLLTGNGIIWGAVLIGVALLTDSGENANLDWPLMWVIVGGFIVQSALLNAYLKNKSE
ncbi:MAG: hypothetical protein U5L95_04200 [Candidatus Saccharibacteria bacterium]|nr:hypothetical protein [Candidatus Saccharibacteria bacterium]